MQVLGDVGATREIAAKLTHEEPQKPSELQEELHHHGHQPDSEEKHVSDLAGWYRCMFTEAESHKYYCVSLPG